MALDHSWTTSGRYWNAVAAEWQSTPPPTLWRRHSDAVNAGLLRRWLPIDRSRRILKTDAFDEAVGDGLLALLTSRSASVVTVDIATSMLEAAAARHARFDGCAGDARALPFADGIFDAIVSISTLDHFTCRDHLVVSLHEMYRILTPGGRLLITLDNPVHPLIALRNALPFRWLNRLGLVPYFVGVTLGPGALRQVLLDTGFEVLETTSVMHSPRVLAIPLAGWLTRYVSPATARRALRLYMGFEVLASLPTRVFTGHFLAVLAVKPLPASVRNGGHTSADRVS